MDRPAPSLTTTVTMVYAPNVQRILDPSSNVVFRLPLSEAPLKAQKVLGEPITRQIPIVTREDSSDFLIVDSPSPTICRDDPRNFSLMDLTKVSPKAMKILGNEDRRPPKHTRSKTKSPSFERTQSKTCLTIERPPANASPKALRLLGDVSLVDSSSDSARQRLHLKASSEEPRTLSVSPQPTPNPSPKAARVLGVTPHSSWSRSESDSTLSRLPPPPTHTLPRTKSATKAKSVEPSSHDRLSIPRSLSEEPTRKCSLSSPHPMSRSESMFKSSTSLATMASDLATVSVDWFSSLTRVNRRKKKNYIGRSAWELSTLEPYGRKQLKDELQEVCADMENIDTTDESKNNNNKSKQMSIGRKKFNMDPKKGIEYLQANSQLQATPEDVAAYLYKGEGLNKTAIGDYLGEKNPFNEKVLRAFVDLHDFTDLILVQALRQFLWSFRLPGEAQKIDRMMECFAQRYCQLNPSIFTNTDTCYVLSFAIIMLNTSLHNPSVKDKPSVEQFINMNRGINNGGDLPRELLVSFYESIKTEPFKIPEDDGNDLMHTFFNPDKEGWLWKQGGRYKSWKRRWFILNDNCLYYFEYTTDKEPRGIIPLENICVREASDRHKPHCFELFATGTDIIKACKTDSEGKVVEGKHTVYRMSAASQDEKDDWMKRLGSSISTNPFYDMLAVRKKKAQKTTGHGSHAT